MNSLVLDLQKDSLDRKVPVSDLLRKALTVARKLGAPEIEVWINHELSGYPMDAEIPEYRTIHGRIEGLNPFHGWQPLQHQDDKTEEFFSRRPAPQSISELETFARADSQPGTVSIEYSGEQLALLHRLTNSGFRMHFRLSTNEFIRIVDHVRNTVLKWALDLEARGVLGNQMSFTTDEKQGAVAATTTIVNNFHGTVMDSQINQASQHVSWTSSESRNQILKFTQELQDSIDRLGLPKSQQQAMVVEVKKIETELSHPNPNETQVKQSLQSIRNITEGAAGNLLASGILATIQYFLK